MEERALKFAAIVVGVCTLATAAALPFFPQMRARHVEAMEARTAEEEYEENQVEMKTLAIVEEPVSGEASNQLRLRRGDKRLCHTAAAH